MNSTSKNSNYSTILLLVFKELRLERSVHQGLIAQMIGKSPSAWNKIENGQSPLSMDVMFGACAALQVYPSYVMGLAESLIKLFNQHGYFFQPGTLEDGEDDLLPLVLRYFSSKGYENLKVDPYRRISATTVGNPFTPGTIPTVVQYCCDENYRKWVDDGATQTLGGLGSLSLGSGLGSISSDSSGISGLGASGHIGFPDI